MQTLSYLVLNYQHPTPPTCTGWVGFPTCVTMTALFAVAEVLKNSTIYNGHLMMDDDAMLAFHALCEKYDDVIEKFELVFDQACGFAGKFQNKLGRVASCFALLRWAMEALCQLDHANLAAKFQLLREPFKLGPAPGQESQLRIDQKKVLKELHLVVLPIVQRSFNALVLKADVEAGFQFVEMTQTTAEVICFDDRLENKPEIEKEILHHHSQRAMAEELYHLSPHKGGGGGVRGGFGRGSGGLGGGGKKKGKGGGGRKKGRQETPWRVVITFDGRVINVGDLAPVATALQPLSFQLICSRMQRVLWYKFISNNPYTVRVTEVDAGYDENGCIGLSVRNQMDDNFSAKDFAGFLATKVYPKTEPEYTVVDMYLMDILFKVSAKNQLTFIVVKSFGESGTADAARLQAGRYFVNDLLREVPAITALSAMEMPGQDKVLMSNYTDYQTVIAGWRENPTQDEENKLAAYTDDTPCFCSFHIPRGGSEEEGVSGGEEEDSVDDNRKLEHRVGDHRRIRNVAQQLLHFYQS